LNTQTTRSYLVIPSAIIIAGVLISASLFFVFAGTKTTVTVTNTASGGTETTDTSTVTETVTQTGASRLYDVEFVQESNCYYASWVAPWAVVVDGQTVLQPSNATLPLSSNEFHFTADSNYSTISFSLPNGTYRYDILPDDPLGSRQSGNITVDGSDVEVQVYAFIMAEDCSSTSSAPG
jgi:hypothetical protein